MISRQAVRLLEYWKYMKVTIPAFLSHYTLQNLQKYWLGQTYSSNKNSSALQNLHLRCFVILLEDDAIGRQM